MNFITALAMRYINLAWSKIMHKELKEDENGRNQKKWFTISIVFTLLIVFFVILSFMFNQ